MRDVYARVILDEMPRLLSLIDRNPKSETYGCCDRNYWQYKTNWFCDARMQEVALTLALVYSNKYPSNVYYKHPKIREWAIVVMRFWAKSQNRDGSFAEHYISEHSFPASVFSTAAIQDAYSTLKIRDTQIHSAIIKAKIWIKKHKETLVSNQEAGAIYVLMDWFRMKDFLKLQKYKGWWPEYNGFDWSYNSLTLSYMARHWRDNPNEELKSALIRLCDFMANNTGAKMSRQCRFCVPLGFEIMAPYSKSARKIADANLQYLKKYGLSYDDKYMASFSKYYILAYNNFYKRKVKNVKPLIIGKPEFLPIRYQRLPSPMKTLVTLPLQAAIGKSDWLSQKAKSYLRKKMILEKKGKGNIHTLSKFFVVDELE